MPKQTTQTVPANPQEWLPIGQGVTVPKNLYRPSRYNAAGKRVHFSDGAIVEHLRNGGVAVKFANYPNVTDYTRTEAMQFTTWS